MKKITLSITIITWLFIAAGIVSFAYHPSCLSCPNVSVEHPLYGFPPTTCGNDVCFFNSRIAN
ncbi:MAG: hypothetical protein HYV29_13585 [Ignavibacteriales bacterium]|nr:hypothetical protein [Ignavibacteriales bacterium]